MAGVDASLTTSTVTLRPKRFGMTSLARREARWGLLFIAPWIIGFLLFTLFPMIATLAFSLTNITLQQTEPLRFVGLKNYETLLNDQQAWASLKVTLTFAAFWLPVTMVVPFVVALMLNSTSSGRPSVFRVLIFLPYVVPFVAGVLIWQSMLLPDGWLDQFLRFIGVANPPDWLNDPTFVYPGLVLVGIWGIGGAVIINMAGLKSVPTELYDAAKIDGAGWSA